MTKFHIFIVRAFLGAAMALLLFRMFYPDKNPIYAGMLAVFLVGVAYFREYLYNRSLKKEQDKEKQKS